MAGRGRRFLEKGYELPKPLIEIKNKPILQWIITSLAIENANYTFIVRRDHVDEFGIDSKIKNMVPGSNVVVIDEITEGAVCTVLLASEYIDNQNPLFLKDCDQIVDWSFPNFWNYFLRYEFDGAITTVPTSNPGFSFCKLAEHGKYAYKSIVATAEKQVISSFGSTGLYFFRRGCDFVNYANSMIEKKIKVNNEYYVSPVYNELIEAGKLIFNYPITDLFSFNTPEELNQNMSFSMQFLAQQSSR